MKLEFSIAFKNDAILGLLPFPYLLRKNEENPYYELHKQLTKRDINNEVIPYNPWIQKIVELFESLSHKVLNEKINKNYQKTILTQFLTKADDSTKKHLKEIVEEVVIKIMDLVKKYEPLIFFKEDRTANVYLEDFIKISKTPIQVKLEFENKEESLSYRLKLFQDNKPLDVLNNPVLIVSNEKPNIIFNKQLLAFENSDFNGNKLKPFLIKEEVTIDKSMQGIFFEKFIKPSVKKFDYQIIGFDLTEIKSKVSAQLIIERTFNGVFVLSPVFIYNNHKVPFYNSQAVFVDVVNKDKEYSLESIERDFNYENKLLEKLSKMGFIRKEKYFCFDENPKDKYEFIELLSEVMPKLVKLKFKINNELFTDDVYYSTPEITSETTEKQDWFDIHIIVKFGEFDVPFKKLKNHILQKKQEYKLPNGNIGIIPESWFAELYPLAKRTNNKNETAVLKTHLSLLKNNTFVKPNQSILDNFDAIEKIEPTELPTKVVATLRDYQKIGFQWLHQLTKNGFGVCLADDMGLGKTLQVITILQKYFQNKKAGDLQANQQTSLEQGLNKSHADATEVFASALLIVPRSLIFNWVQELKKFAPELSYFVYHNNKRKEEFSNKLHQNHIIITTYGVVRKDIEILRNIDFSYCILDESQAIKNPQSKSYQAVLQLKSQSRISITGTPMENKLTDLWAQMNFLNQDMLGNLPYFEKTYLDPIGKDSNMPELQELKDIISPFILRRLKSEVAKELPDKIEQVIYCEMDEEQKELYETEKSAIRNQLLFSQKKKNYIDAIAVLNRLRQIALHPAMLDKESALTSGKFESIIHSIENLLEQGHKFLIFSSFVKHLTLIQQHFESKDIAYSMLTGKDQNRQKIVEDFQNNKDIKPFLISIKAGGVGLNITAASYVLIIDPWWNPFVEQQAIDRTHRIGQTENVIIYKFITKDSIEEKILSLQQSKIKMNDALINESDSYQLSSDEIAGLLE